MTKTFSRDLIVHPYQVSKQKLGDFELIKSLVNLMDQPNQVSNTLSIFNRRPPATPNDFHMNTSVNRALNMQLGRSKKYYRTIGLPSNLREGMEAYTGRDLSEYYYLSEYGDFLDIDEIPVVNYTNEIEKLRQLYITIFNQLFKNQEKNFQHDVFKVKFEDKRIDNYEFFVNNKIYLQGLGKNKELFDLINQYFVSILHYRDHNFSLEKLFEYTTLKNKVSFDLNTKVLTIDLDLVNEVEPVNGVKSPHYYYKLWFFLGKLIDFFTITDLIDIYRKDVVLPDISSEQEVFLEFIKDRRIPVSEIEHKGAAKKADALGMTHVFLPLDEEAIPAGIPFSLKVVLEKHNKIANIWSVLPPVQGNYVVREYVGHNNTYPDFTTKTEPHLIGEELMKAQLDDSFYEELVNNYDWEHRAEAENTLALINEFPRLGNDLRSIAKERTAND